MSERFGATLPGPDERPVHAFPAAEALAGARESDLRECRIGFRAKYLRSTAERVATGAVDLGAIGAMALSGARERLESLPGVGPKIADCVLLFAYGFGRAFPVDVWVMRALRDLYFRGRNTPLARLRRFSEDYFGAQAGYAQQYLFHHIRMRSGRVPGRGT